MYSVGLDLHKRYVTACALDSTGAVAVEATLHWGWVHDQLTAAGYPVVVAHPQQVKLICHARC